MIIAWAFVLKFIGKLLLYSSLSFGATYFSKNNFNKKLRSNFKRIGDELQFSFFLQKRNVFNAIAPPALSGMWKERAVDFTSTDYVNQSFKISMTTGNKRETFKIQPKKIWKSLINKSQIIKTDNQEMNKKFLIKGTNSTFIQSVFDKELAHYFVLHQNAIKHTITIKPYEISVIFVSAQKEENMKNGSLEKDIKFMLSLMDKIANRMENVAYSSRLIGKKSIPILV